MSSTQSSSTSTGSSKRNTRKGEDLIHLYILKFESRQQKLLKILDKMYAIADNDLVICDHQTGLNDYTMNKKFADKLDNLAKLQVTTSGKCCEKAMQLWLKISEAEDKKCLDNQEIFFIEEIIKEGDKSAIIQSCKSLRSSRFKSDPDCLPPPPPVKRKHTITISSDEEGDIYAGDPDT